MSKTGLFEKLWNKYKNT